MGDRQLKIDLEVVAPRDLLVRYYPNGKLGGLAVDGRLPGPLGQKCELRVRTSLPVRRHFNVQVQLAWARHQRARGLSERFGVDFLPEDDPGRERLLSYAKEELEPSVTRFEERLMIDLAVKITHGGQVRQEVLFDLSPGGAFVRCAVPAPVGSQLEFDVRKPLSLSHLRLWGRVAWVRQTGSAPGMGIEFLFHSPEQAQSLRKLWDRMGRG